MRGYLTAWKKFGQLQWRELVQPAIDIAKKGFTISKAVSDTLEDIKKRLDQIDAPGLR